MSSHRFQLIAVVAVFALYSAASTSQDAEPLGSSEQFRVDQIQRSLDNVDKDLQRIATADREGAASLARKGAERNLAQARERFEQFVARHPELSAHPDVESARARLDRLAAAVEGASSADESDATPAQASVEAGGQSPAPADAIETRNAPTGDSTPQAEPELSRRQKFELQQIDMTLNDAGQRLEAYRQAERDDVAALALKGAKRGRDEAGEKLDTFVDSHPDAGQAEQVAALRERIGGLTASIAQAESAAGAKAAAAESAGANATADAERVLSLRSESADALDAIHGRSVVYSDSADGARKAVAVIESAEAAAEQIRPVLLAFQERYGDTESEIEQALNNAGADASSSNSRVAYNAAELLEFLEQLGETRAVSAETVAENVAARLADIDDYSAKVQQQRLDEAAEMVRIGQNIDPNNPRLNRLRGEVAQLAQAKRDEQMARIASATWPGHVADFDGPGAVEDLADSVHDYLANDRDWGQSQKRPQEVLAVSVIGSWQVAEKDLFGRPIQWRLPVMVAITDDDLKPDGVAQAFEMSMVAKQGAPNAAPKSPPWDGFWVGDNYYLETGELP